MGPRLVPEIPDGGVDFIEDFRVCEFGLKQLSF